MTKLSSWNTARLPEIFVSTPSPSCLHRHWSKSPSSLGFHHKLLELASLLFKFLLHSITRLCFISANQIAIPLLKTHKGSFSLGTKSRILTWAYEGLCGLLFPSLTSPDTSHPLTCHSSHAGCFPSTPVPECSSCEAPLGGL